MTCSNTVVVLEVRRGSEPVTGSLRADGGPPRAFTGWLELTQALTEAFAWPVETDAEAKRRDHR